MPELWKNLNRGTASCFPSKKNNVYYFPERKIVIKVFNKRASAEKEYRLLELAVRNNIAVPKPYALDENQLVMEYVNGDSLCDLINAEPLEKYAIALAQWLSAFHQRLRISRGDGNLRNYIWHSERVFGVDFEEAEENDMISDVVETVCSIIDTDPMFTPAKYHLSEILMKEYETASNKLIERKKFWFSVAELLKRKVQRRPSQKEILMKEAERLTKHYSQLMAFQLLVWY